MKSKNIGFSLAIITALGFGFTGCSSSSGNSSSGTTTQTGTFLDAPVQGLKYITATQSGYTNDKGEFKYVAGETVEFKLGNISLGSKIGSALMTPYTLGDSNTTNPSAKTTNIAMLLQSLDGNRSNSNILDLSKLKDYSFNDVNLSATTNDITTKLNNILITGNFVNDFADGNTTVINATIANSALKTFVKNNSIKFDKKFTVGYLNGKTFYIPTSWYQNQKGTYSIVKMVFTDSTLVMTGYDNDPADLTPKPYIITSNGQISFNANGTQALLTISSVDNNNISITAFGNYGEPTTMYKNQSEAQAKLVKLQN